MEQPNRQNEVELEEITTLYRKNKIRYKKTHENVKFLIDKVSHNQAARDAYTKTLFEGKQIFITYKSEGLTDTWAQREINVNDDDDVDADKINRYCEQLEEWMVRNKTRNGSPKIYLKTALVRPNPINVNDTEGKAIGGKYISRVYARERIPPDTLISRVGGRLGKHFKDNIIQMAANPLNDALVAPAPIEWLKKFYRKKVTLEELDEIELNPNEMYAFATCFDDSRTPNHRHLYSTSFVKFAQQNQVANAKLVFFKRKNMSNGRYEDAALCLVSLNNAIEEHEEILLKPSWEWSDFSKEELEKWARQKPPELIFMRLNKGVMSTKRKRVNSKDEERNDGEEDDDVEELEDAEVNVNEMAIKEKHQVVSTPPDNNDDDLEPQPGPSSAMHNKAVVKQQQQQQQSSLSSSSSILNGKLGTVVSTASKKKGTSTKKTPSVSSSTRVTRAKSRAVKDAAIAESDKASGMTNASKGSILQPIPEDVPILSPPKKRVKPLHNKTVNNNRPEYMDVGGDGPAEVFDDDASKSPARVQVISSSPRSITPNITPPPPHPRPYSAPIGGFSPTTTTTTTTTTTGARIGIGAARATTNTNVVNAETSMSPARQQQEVERQVVYADVGTRMTPSPAAVASFPSPSSSPRPHTAGSNPTNHEDNCTRLCRKCCLPICEAADPATMHFLEEDNKGLKMYLKLKKSRVSEKKMDRLKEVLENPKVIEYGKAPTSLVDSSSKHKKKAILVYQTAMHREWDEVQRICEKSSHLSLARFHELKSNFVREREARALVSAADMEEEIKICGSYFHIVHSCMQNEIVEQIDCGAAGFKKTCKDIKLEMEKEGSSACSLFIIFFPAIYVEDNVLLCGDKEFWNLQNFFNETFGISSEGKSQAATRICLYACFGSGPDHPSRRKLAIAQVLPVPVGFTASSKEIFQNLNSLVNKLEETRNELAVDVQLSDIFVANHYASQLKIVDGIDDYNYIPTTIITGTPSPYAKDLSRLSDGPYSHGSGSNGVGVHFFAWFDPSFQDVIRVVAPLVQSLFNGLRLETPWTSPQRPCNEEEFWNLVDVAVKKLRRKYSKGRFAIILASPEGDEKGGMLGVDRNTRFRVRYSSVIKRVQKAMGLRTTEVLIISNHGSGIPFQSIVRVASDPQTHTLKLMMSSPEMARISLCQVGTFVGSVVDKRRKKPCACAFVAVASEMLASNLAHPQNGYMSTESLMELQKRLTCAINAASLKQSFDKLVVHISTLEEIEENDREPTVTNAWLPVTLSSSVRVVQEVANQTTKPTNKAETTSRVGQIKSRQQKSQATQTPEPAQAPVQHPPQLAGQAHVQHPPQVPAQAAVQHPPQVAAQAAVQQQGQVEHVVANVAALYIGPQFGPRTRAEYFEETKQKFLSFLRGREKLSYWLGRTSRDVYDFQATACELLRYASGHELSAIPELPFAKLRCLYPRGLLNDEVIKQYIILIAQRNMERHWKNVELFEVLFGSMIFPFRNGDQIVEPDQARLKSKMRRFTPQLFRRNSIFFFPGCIREKSCDTGHWIFLSYEADRNILKFYDTLSLESAEMLNRTHQLIIYALENGALPNNENFVTPDLTQITKIDETRRVKTQINTTDCGVFVCQNIEMVARGVEPTAHQDDMPMYRAIMLLEILLGRLLDRT